MTLSRLTTAAAALACAGSVATATDYTVPGPSNESLKFYLESPLSPVVAGDTLILTDAGFYQTTYVVSDSGLTIKAAAGHTIVIDGQFAGTVFECLAENTTFEGLTIRGGLAAIDGGAIRAIANNLTIRDCRFEDNIAPDDGGAIVFSDGILTIEDSEFVNNSTQGSTSQSAGGAIQSVRGDVTLRRCTFMGNDADYAGGALHIADTDARYRIEDCTFDGNTATFGGAIWWMNDAEGDVFDTVFDGNIAGLDGGGVYHNASPATYTRCRFINNQTDATSGDDGGAMYISGETTNEVTAISCLFANNSARSSGGGVLMDSGPDPSFLNCTFADNAAQTGSGGAVHTSGANATGFFRNNIVWGNTPQQFAGPTGLFNSNVEGGGAGTNVIDVDPMFVDAPGGDYRLMEGSPSIDAGDTNFWSSSPEPLDLDLEPRVMTAAASPMGLPLIGLYVDQGAYEFQPDGTGGGCLGDIDGDGDADPDDITAFVNAFIAGCPG